MRSGCKSRVCFVVCQELKLLSMDDRTDEGIREERSRLTRRLLVTSLKYITDSKSITCFAYHLLS